MKIQAKDAISFTYLVVVSSQTQVKQDKLGPHSLSMLPNWIHAISTAIDKSEFFVPMLSNNSVNRLGMIVKEVQRALDKWRGILPGDIYVIPIRLDDCPIPEFIQHMHVLDWEAGKGKSRLFKAIDVAMKRRNQ